VGESQLLLGDIHYSSLSIYKYCVIPTNDKLNELHVEVLEASVATVKHHRDFLSILFPNKRKKNSLIYHKSTPIS